MEINKKNILILSGNFPVRSETFVIQHVTGLLERGFDVNVIANNGDSDAWENIGEFQSELINKVKNYRMPKSKFVRVIGALNLLIKNLLKGRFKYFRCWNIFRFGRSVINLSLPYTYDAALDIGSVDLIHCHFGPVGVLGAHLKQLGVSDALIVTFHGYDVSRVLNANIQSNPYKFIFKEADLLLPISEHWKARLLVLGAPPERTIVHRVGIDLSKFSFVQRLALIDCIRIVTTARLVEKKGIKYAIEAIAKVKRYNPDINLKYDLIGDGPLRNEIELLIEANDISDIVQLHGSQPHENVKKMLLEADLFLLPSVTASDGDQEGIPVALMEAMASGAPVLSTVHSGIPELVEHNKSGILVPEGDSDALAESIIYLVKHPKSWIVLGRTGRDKILSDYNLEEQNNLLVEIYQNIIKEKYPVT